MTWNCLQKMYYNAMWAAEMANANGNTELTLRYWKIATYIENRMWNFKSVNTFKS